MFRYPMVGMAILATALLGGGSACVWGSIQEPRETLETTAEVPEQGPEKPPSSKFSPVFIECMRRHSAVPESQAVLSAREVASRVAMISIRCEPTDEELDTYGRVLGRP